MITLNVLSVCSNTEVSKDIEKSLAPIDGVNLDSRSGDLLQILPGIGSKEHPDVVILEMAEGQSDLDEIQKEISRISEDIEVIVTHKTVDVSMMRALMRLGVRDFLPQPVSKQELINLFTDILSEKRSKVMDDRGNLASVYTFLNAKGGSGASTIAVNVAATLAQKKSCKVALLDFDIQLGVVDLFLDLHSNSNIYDAIVQSHRVDPVFLKSLMAQHESGLEVLTSPSNLTSIAEVNADDIKKILDAAAESYDIVIIDLPKIFNAWTMQVLKSSEKIYLVLQNSISATRDAKVILDNLPKQGIHHSSIELVNNRAEAAMGAVTTNELNDTLKVSSIHNIRTDYKAAINAQNQGKLISDVASSSKLSKDLEDFAKHLLSQSKGKTENNPKHSKKGLFSRIIGRS